MARPVLRSRNSHLCEELGVLIARTRRLIWETATRRLGTTDESVHALRILGHLARTGPCGQRELAEATAQHPAGVCRLLEEMEGQRMVVRRRNRADRRKALVEVTARGSARYEAARPQIGAAVDEVLGALSVAERRALRALLTKVLAHEAVEARSA